MTNRDPFHPTAAFEKARREEEVRTATYASVEVTYLMCTLTVKAFSLGLDRDKVLSMFSEVTAAVEAQMEKVLAAQADEANG
jgi:intracellular sulfur oxidation DsrE/DsrF family protein